MKKSDSSHPLNESITRRTALKLVTAGTLVGLGGQTHKTLAADSTDPNFTRDEWDKTHDRVWLGGDHWANPMEDWRVINGGAECQSMGTNRSIHSLTHQLSNHEGSISMTVTMTTLDQSGNDGGAGFRLGIRSELNEYRSNCFVGKGINAGIANGRLVLGDISGSFGKNKIPDTVRLELKGRKQGRNFQLSLEAYAPRQARPYARAMSHILPTP